MSISLCIVARNEASFLRECIESAAPISDEVILVDTGSADATREIARQAGARVIEKEWPGDLAAAHSLPLAHARGDWILSLDGDEALDPQARPEIRELVRSRKADGYLFTIRNYLYDLNAKWRWADSTDPLVKGALGYCPNVAVRLFRRRPSYRYSGRLHQNIAPSILAAGGKIGRTDVPIHHYGHIRFDRSKSCLYADLTRREVARQPRNARAWLDLGIVLLGDEKSSAPAAAAAFRQARSLGEKPTAAYFLGRALIGMRQSAAAIPFLSEAVRGNPRDELIFFDRADAWELLGIAHDLTGNTALAEDAYRMALRSRPESPVALNNLTDLLGERGALREAEQLAGRLLERCRGLATTWTTLGTVRLRQGDWKGACDAFETALDINPENLPARVNLAVGYERGGRPGKARRAYIVAGERSDSPEAWQLGLAEHLPPAHRRRSIRLRPLGPGAVVSVIGHLAGGGGRVVVDAVLALRGRPQLVLCADAGAYTGQELRAEIEKAGVRVCTVGTENGIRAILGQVQPEVVLHHWSKGPFALAGVRVGAERWIAIGHATVPMPFGYDAYVVLSAFHEVLQSHLPAERLTRISNGVRLRAFRPRKPRPARRPPVIAMLSRLAAGKFPRRLLEYLPPLKDLNARLRVAGFGRRRFEIEPEIARRGLEKFVSFLGPIPSARVPRFLSEADIGLHLTEVHAELCSLTILEMMASGLPIVAEPKGCLPEMIVHGENGFLATDESEIAEYLKELIISPKLRRQMGTASLAMSKRYDFAHFRASLRALIAETTRLPAKAASGTLPGHGASARQTGPKSQPRARREEWRPSLCYLICATPRSGSSLLCESLSNTGLAGAPEEVFCSIGDERWSLPERGETTDVKQYFEWLFEDRATPNGVFGAKIMLNHFLQLCARLQTLPGRTSLNPHARLRSVFPNLCYVWMRRRDKLRQAISWTRAAHANQWRQLDGDLSLSFLKARFNRNEIERQREELAVQEATWQAFFDASGIEPVVIWYEDLAGSYEATARRVLEELGIRVPRQIWFGERRLLGQSDAITEDWLQRLGSAPVSGKSPDSKLDLNDVTFLVPFHLDSPERARNLRHTIKYLSDHFSTRIIVGEHGTSRLADALGALRKKVETVSFRFRAQRFHRTQLLNRMLKLVSTPLVCICDCDVIFPLRQYVCAASLLRRGEADFVFPFDGHFYDVPEDAKDELIAALPRRARRTERFKDLVPGDVSVGGAFFSRTDVYRASGGENQAFIRWGWEDRERVARFEKLGRRILRVPGDCFHLQHPPGTQRSAWHEDFAANRRQYERIAALSPKKLRAEIARWAHIRSSSENLGLTQ